MDPHDKRRAILNQLKNTFIKISTKDETISRRKIINEIITVFEVSYKTASGYIKELIEMGTINRKDDMLWHTKEKDIRLEYLCEKAK